MQFKLTDVVQRQQHLINSTNIRWFFYLSRLALKHTTVCSLIWIQLINSSIKFQKIVTNSDHMHSNVWWCLRTARDSETFREAQILILQFNFERNKYLKRSLDYQVCCWLICCWSSNWWSTNRFSTQLGHEVCLTSDLTQHHWWVWSEVCSVAPVATPSSDVTESWSPGECGGVVRRSAKTRFTRTI